MKSGAGDDPFSDLLSNEEGDEGDDAPDQSASDAAHGGDTTSESPPERAGSNEREESASSDPAGDDSADIPWILRRRSVKDDRPNVTQFFLRDETDRAERRFRGEVEDRLDTDVYLLDLREAAYVVAMQHPGEVAALLGRWGYDYRD